MNLLISSALHKLCLMYSAVYLIKSNLDLWRIILAQMVKVFSWNNGCIGSWKVLLYHIIYGSVCFKSLRQSEN